MCSSTPFNVSSSRTVRSATASSGVRRVRMSFSTSKLCASASLAEAAASLAFLEVRDRIRASRIARSASLAFLLILIRRDQV